MSQCTARYGACGRRRGAVFAAIGAALVGTVALSAQQKPLPPGAFGENVEVVGYTDLNGKPAFKLAIREVNGKWYLYAGSFWVRGWSIVDVTDPAKPSVAKFIEGPQNTSTVQMDWAGKYIEVPLSKIPEGRDFDPSKPYEAGFWLFDNSDPLNPKKVGSWKSAGTHRNYYDDGKYVHAAADFEGYQGHIYAIVDVQDKANPKEVGRWWVKGQHVGGGEKPPEPGISMHGPAMPVGNRVYLPYGSAGMIILDISDVTKPKEIGRLDFAPPFKYGITVHSVLPLEDRGIAIVNSEAGPDLCAEPSNQAAIVDIKDPSKPFLISLLPRPLAPPGYPLKDFCDKGRFGPHNINQLQQSPDVQKQGNLLYLTYFTAGLRFYDISDPRAPREVGYFIPQDPVKRYGPRPANALVTNTEDVLVDRRGYIYITDRNHGIWVLRYTGPQPGSRATQ